MSILHIGSIYSPKDGHSACYNSLTPRIMMQRTSPYMSQMKFFNHSFRLMPRSESPGPFCTENFSAVPVTRQPSHHTNTHTHTHTHTPPQLPYISICISLPVWVFSADLNKCLMRVIKKILQLFTPLVGGQTMRVLFYTVS